MMMGEGRGEGGGVQAMFGWGLEVMFGDRFTHEHFLCDLTYMQTHPHTHTFCGTRTVTDMATTHNLSDPHSFYMVLPTTCIFYHQISILRLSLRMLMQIDGGSISSGPTGFTSISHGFIWVSPATPQPRTYR